MLAFAFLLVSCAMVATTVYLAYVMYRRIATLESELKTTKDTLVKYADRLGNKIGAMSCADEATSDAVAKYAEIQKQGMRKLRFLQSNLEKTKVGSEQAFAVVTTAVYDLSKSVTDLAAAMGMLQDNVDKVSRMMVDMQNADFAPKDYVVANFAPKK